MIIVDLAVKAAEAAETVTQDRWGTYPDWIAAVSTSLALIGAAVAVGYTHAANGREEDRDDRYELAQRSNQASKVAVWEHRGKDELGEYVGYALRNSSDNPIYDVRIFSYSQKRDMNGNVYKVTEEFRTRHQNVPPLTTQHWEAITATHNWTEEVAQLGIELGFAVQFRDSANIVWTRNIHGVLHEGAAAEQHFPEQPSVRRRG